MNKFFIVNTLLIVCLSLFSCSSDEEEEEVVTYTLMALDLTAIDTTQVSTQDQLYFEGKLQVELEKYCVYFDPSQVPADLTLVINQIDYLIDSSYVETKKCDGTTEKILLKSTECTITFEILDRRENKIEEFEEFMVIDEFILESFESTNELGEIECHEPVIIAGDTDIQSIFDTASKNIADQINYYVL